MTPDVARSSLRLRAAPPRQPDAPAVSMVDLAIQSRFYDWQCSQLLSGQHRDVLFYEALAREMGGPILELGCGTGRLVTELARGGHDVTGLDINPHALRTARARMARDRDAENAELVEGDMRTFDLGRTFRLIVMAYNSFQCITDGEDQRDCLAAVARHLAPNGIAVFELTRFELTARATESFEHRVTDWFEGAAATVAMYERVRHEHACQLTHFDERYVLFHPGLEPLTLEYTLTLRTVHRYEMQLLLETAGMRVRSLYGTYDRGRFDSPDAHTMLVVAERTV